MVHIKRRGRENDCATLVSGHRVALYEQPRVGDLCDARLNARLAGSAQIARLMPARVPANGRPEWQQVAAWNGSNAVVCARRCLGALAFVAAVQRREAKVHLGGRRAAFTRGGVPSSPPPILVCVDNPY